jgi:hypothetical protein
MRKYSYIFAATAIWSLLSMSAGNAQTAQTCWLVFGDEPTATSGRNDADELICMKTASTGYVLESSIFGTGVKGCNKVTINREGNGYLLRVDYSKCTNNSPNHSFSCASLAGDAVKCIETMEGHEGQADSYLKSCPKHWCNKQ